MASLLQGFFLAGLCRFWAMMALGERVWENFSILLLWLPVSLVRSAWLGSLGIFLVGEGLLMAFAPRGKGLDLDLALWRDSVHSGLLNGLEPRLRMWKGLGRGLGCGKGSEGLIGGCLVEWISRGLAREVVMAIWHGELRWKGRSEG